MRTAAHALSLLADPLDVRVLLALRDGPLPLIDLRRTIGSASETTARKHLKALADCQILLRVREPGFPGSVSHDLSPAGRELLETADVVSAWLAAAPGGPLFLGAPGAKSAIKSLVGGWSTRILRAIAAKPLSLTELDRVLTGVNYPALARRLGAMRLAGQVVPVPGRGISTPYMATEWLRTAVRTLASGASWEHRYPPTDSRALDRIDIETLFLLAAPMLQLSPDLDGSCRLAVEMADRAGRPTTGFVVRVKSGRLTSCLGDPDAKTSSLVTGPPIPWLEMLDGGGGQGLKFHGDRELAGAVLAGVQRHILKCS